MKYCQVIYNLKVTKDNLVDDRIKNVSNSYQLITEEAVISINIILVMKYYHISTFLNVTSNI